MVKSIKIFNKNYFSSFLFIFMAFVLEYLKKTILASNRFVHLIKRERNYLLSKRCVFLIFINKNK